LIRDIGAVEEESYAVKTTETNAFGYKKHLNFMFLLNRNADGEVAYIF
jgi:hypothetical protein